MRGLRQELRDAAEADEPPACQAHLREALHLRRVRRGIHAFRLARRPPEARPHRRETLRLWHLWQTIQNWVLCEGKSNGQSGDIGCYSKVFQVHKEAHYKNTTTPVKNSNDDEDTPLHVNIESYNDEGSNDTKTYNDDNEESPIEEMDENDTDSLNDTSEVAGQDVMRFSMTQDSFIEDSPLAMARVIWRKLIKSILFKILRE